MAQCKGTTKSGAQCRRSAREGFDYCSIHTEATSSPGRKPDPGLDLSDTGKVILGLVMIGAIVFLFGGLRNPRLF